MWPAHSHFWVLFVENLLLTSLLISSLSAASLPDYHETLLELPNIDNKQTEKPEIFLEELDTSRRTHRLVDLSGGDDREVSIFDEFWSVLLS